MRFSRFILLLAVSAACIYCVPFDAKLIPLSVSALRSHDRITITGNSVLSHASKCDVDRRSIPGMLAGQVGQPVLDLSFPGQGLSESVNLAALSLRNPNTRAVVVPISLFALQEWDSVDIRVYAAYRLLNPSISADSLASRLASPGALSPQRAPTQQAYVYHGVRYPDYAGIKHAFFDPEEDAMGCPENNGRNMEFIAGLYWHEYIELPYQQPNFAMLASLGALARAQDKALQIVLMPVDVELMTALLPNDVPLLRARIAGVVKTLRDSGLAVTDLTAASPNQDFVDRWCACGHQGQHGRLTVAQGIGQALSARLPPLAAQR